ncbi:suppressor of fused domain protein [Roseateles noduli]|uniref:suppressor of fused domain protein n=1 Tax=Roseateles noduli TaxID=2052484 RepID=UPI003D65FEB9
MRIAFRRSNACLAVDQISIWRPRADWRCGRSTCSRTWPAASSVHTTSSATCIGPANGPIKNDADADIVGLLFVTDPERGSIDTPHGLVDLLQMVGITSAEVEDLKANRRTARAIAAELAASNPPLITNLDRSSR